MQLLLLFKDQKEYVLNKLRVLGDNSENPVHVTYSFGDYHVVLMKPTVQKHYSAADYLSCWHLP